MTSHRTHSKISASAAALSLLAVGPLATTPANAEQTASPAGAALTEWTLDTAHSKIGFAATHMVVSEVEGQFRDVSATVRLDEKDPTRSQLELTAQVASIDTGTPDRDKHLKSPDFFDAARYPTITFKSKQIRRAGKGYKITGELTMRGVTREVTLDATLSDAVMNPWGKWVRAAKLSGEIDRREFGVTWNKSLDKGGLVVGDTVRLDVKVEINK